ncbi:MAG: GcrA cell cycle regulator [Ahrensia sp.]|nr:GcrA cell cycle regulator [Ahrensia sp.]
MAWTDERVARLIKLWKEGLSASQIAKDLGDVTRNAVIGKLHRMGHSGRDKPAAKSGGVAPRRKTSSATRSKSVGGGSATYARAASARTTTQTVGNAALKMELDAEAEVEIEIEERRVEDVVVPISLKLSLMELTENTCKWPTGDPTLPGFSFCGQKSEEDKPYCAFHSKQAYQPPNERRRRR